MPDIPLPPSPITQDNIEDAFAAIFAPWIQEMGFTDWEVREGFCSARLPQNPRLQFFSGATCGQAIMAAVDTVAAIAVGTTERSAKGTAYQHTHFLRPAAGDDLVIACTVERFGKSTAYINCRVTYAQSGKLCAHAVLEFAF